MFRNASSNNGGGLLSTNSENNLLSDQFNPDKELEHVKREFHKYDKFEEIVLDYTKPLLQYFSEGNFDLLFADLSSNTFTNLGQVIDDTDRYTGGGGTMRYYVYDPATFDLYRSYWHKIIDTLKRGKTLYDKKESWKLKAIKNKETLYNKDNLLEFIDNYYNGFVGIDAGTIDLSIDPTVKPQYVRYIERYGAPPGGCFESEKMTVVINELIQEGVLQQEDLDNFLSSTRVQLQSQQPREIEGEFDVILTTSSESGDSSNERSSFTLSNEENDLSSIAGDSDLDTLSEFSI